MARVGTGVVQEEPPEKESLILLLLLLLLSLLLPLYATCIARSRKCTPSVPLASRSSGGIGTCSLLLSPLIHTAADVYASRRVARQPSPGQPTGPKEKIDSMN
jgi:hypothetical protein